MLHLCSQTNLNFPKAGYHKRDLIRRMVESRIQDHLVTLFNSLECFTLDVGSFLGLLTFFEVLLCQVLPVLSVILICGLSLSSPMEFINYV